MLAQVLSTKLHAPPHRAELIARPRLMDRLEEGARRRLTLLSAPAGFGKTTLVSAWASARTRPVAWLSLDADDTYLDRFLAHLIASLRTVAPELGFTALAGLDAPRNPPTTWLLSELINDIAAVEGELVLVLDDYHAVDAEAVDEALGYLLEHQPPGLHLVLTTREDPNLRLAALRARGELVELRAADLRFTPEETADFLRRGMALDLAAEDIAALEARTEGWIAGLQLAALSMRGRDDPSAFIRAFAGDHRYVVDYLVEEVLAGQPDGVRAFLLQTSVLERLCGSLCDAVTGRTGSDAQLESLERANLFLVPLDDRRRWYRYHPLFGEVLRAHLSQQQPERLPLLHARASAWFEAREAPDEAVAHALAAGDVERAARLIELAWRAMDSSFRSAHWLGWVRALPQATVRSRPVLAAGHAWALLNAGELEAADDRLRDVEDWLAANPATRGWPERTTPQRTTPQRTTPQRTTPERTEAARAEAARAAGEGSSGEEVAGESGEGEGVAGLGAAASQATAAGEAELRALPGTVASARAFHALASGDPATSLAHARRALELLAPSDHVGRGVPLGILALAHWANGDLEEAHGILSRAMAGFRQAGNVLASLSGTFALAEIRLAQGRLRDAARTYEEARHLLEGLEEAAVPGAAEVHLGLAEVRLEQGDRDAAREGLRRVEELGEGAVLPGDEARLRMAMARLEAGLGHASRALALLDEAERLRIRSPMPELQPIGAWRARLWSGQGAWEAALAWARDAGLPVEGELPYLREFEHGVLARTLLARARSGDAPEAAVEAETLLERMRVAAEARGRWGSVVEIELLRALALELQGRARDALEPLERALGLAGPEGYLRCFVDEGAPMASLLRRCAKRGDGRAYAKRLLAAFPDAVGVPPSARAAEALTEREAEVLRFLASDLSGPEIARRLGVSLNTLRTHTKNVYGKLGVNTRRQAQRRAEELGLL